MAVELTRQLDGRDTAAIADELVARADALRPRLRELQPETERRGYYSEEIHQAFLDAGFYQILQPRMFGGLELDVPTFYRVMVAVARGCPSTGWCLTLGAGHNLQAASWFEEPTQRKLFAAGYFIAPLTFVPGEQATVTHEASGYRVSGTWRYASGVPYATHFMGIAPHPDDPEQRVIVVVPRGQYRMLDDWGDMLGLKGSGSNSVVVQDALIPEDFVLPLRFDEDLSQGTPGSRLHGDPLYAGRFAAFAVGELVSSQLGAAQAMLDEYEQQMRTAFVSLPGGQSSRVPRYLHHDFQRHWGQAVPLIDAAEATLQRSAELYMAYCRRGFAGGKPMTQEEALRLSGMQDVVGQLCWQAGDILFRSASSSAARDGQRMQRYWRDLSTFHNNGQHQPDHKAPRLAQVHFGATPG